MTAARGMAVEVSDVVRVFRGRDGAEVRAVDGVSLSVPAGACAAVVGPSGCGKSTLLGLVGALDRPTAGDVLHDGAPLSTASAAARARLRRTIGFVFQNAPMLRGLPVWENVTQALVPAGVGTRARRDAALRALEPFGITGLAERAPEELSGGERQRAALARALVAEPLLLVADEPTSQLDPASAASVAEGVRAAHAAGCTVVLASHDPALRALATTVLEMSFGRAVTRANGR